ncbi:MAG: phage portal protein [Balneola sp.]
MKLTERLKAATRFVFGNYEIEKTFGFSDPYETNITKQRNDYRGYFYRCLEIRANAVADALLRSTVQRKVGQEWEDVEASHPWNQLLDCPVTLTDLDAHSFYKLLALSIDINGHLPLFVGSTRMGFPTSFIPIYKDFGNIDPVPNALGGIDGWVYWRNDGNRVKYKYEDALWVKRNSPFNPYESMSLVQAALYELDLDLYMKTYRKDSVQQGGFSAATLQTDQKLNTAELNTMKQEFKRYLGSRGLGKVMVTHSGLKVVNGSQSAKDLEYVEGNVQNKDDLQFITGVPEGLFSKNANRANSESAERTLIQYTIQPLANTICSQLTSQFERLFKAKKGVLRIVAPDLMPLDKEFEMMERESQLRTGQRNINEFRVKDGEQPIPLGDKYMISAGMMLLEDMVTVNDSFSPKKKVNEA